MEPSLVYKDPEASFCSALTLPLRQAFWARAGCWARTVRDEPARPLPHRRSLLQEEREEKGGGSEYRGGEGGPGRLEGHPHLRVGGRGQRRMKLQGSMKGVKDNYTSALTRALVQTFGVHRFIYHDNRILWLQVTKSQCKPV